MAVWGKAPGDEQYLLFGNSFNSNFVHVRLDYMIYVHGRTIYPKISMMRKALQAQLLQATRSP